MAGEEQDIRIAALEDQVADLQEQVVALFKYQASMEKTLEVLLSNADIAWNVSTTFEAFISGESAFPNSLSCSLFSQHLPRMCSLCSAGLADISLRSICLQSPE